MPPPRKSPRANVSAPCARARHNRGARCARALKNAEKRADTPGSSMQKSRKFLKTCLSASALLRLSPMSAAARSAALALDRSERLGARQAPRARCAGAWHAHCRALSFPRFWFATPLGTPVARPRIFTPSAPAAQPRTSRRPGSAAGRFGSSVYPDPRPPRVSFPSGPGSPHSARITHALATCPASEVPRNVRR